MGEVWVLGILTLCHWSSVASIRVFRTISITTVSLRKCCRRWRRIDVISHFHRKLGGRCLLRHTLRPRVCCACAILDGARMKGRLFIATTTANLRGRCRGALGSDLYRGASESPNHRTAAVRSGCRLSRVATHVHVDRENAYTVLHCPAL